MADADQIVDITVIGGGPTGLAAAYYGGHRDATVRIVERLEQLGGQVSAVYPEKHIFDVAGFPKINGQALIDQLTDQALQYAPDVRLGTVIETIEHRDDETIALHTAGGETLLTRTMIVTAGHGAFEPRKLGVDTLEAFAGNGLHYYVREKAAFTGKRVALVGGGDSALDWALNLQDTAQLPITLIHRRDRFRGLESSVNEVRRLAGEGGVRILTPHEVRGAEGNGRLEAITVENTRPARASGIELDACVDAARASCRISARSPTGAWSSRTSGRSRSPRAMETNLPGVYAAGDVAGYRRQDHADHDRLLGGRASRRTTPSPASAARRPSRSTPRSERTTPRGSELTPRSGSDPKCAGRLAPWIPRYPTSSARACGWCSSASIPGFARRRPGITSPTPGTTSGGCCTTQG